MTATLVLGIGSPQGDDRAGWLALEQLAGHAAVRAAGAAVALESLDRPGLALLGRWAGARKVILIDAVRSGAPPGTLHRALAGDLAAGGSGASSHGFGLAEAVSLAAALDMLPPELVVLGIEAGEGSAADAPLSPAVAGALPRLVAAALREIGAPAGQAPRV